MFIGAGIYWPALKARLDAALLPADDFTPDRWTGLSDPFPARSNRKAA